MDRRAAAGAAGAGVLVAVACAALEGPARFVPPFRLGSIGEGQQTPVRTPAPFPTHAATPGGTTDLRWLVVVVVVVVLLVVVLLLLLPLRALLARRREPQAHVTLAPSVPAAASARPVGAGEADPEVVQRGVRAAIDSWGAARDPADAVVRAWLALQQTAEDAGVGRSPSETPSEFAVRVLARTATDREPVRELLRLYLTARFGAEPVGAAQSALALAALEAIERSWAPRAASAR